MAQKLIDSASGRAHSYLCLIIERELGVLLREVASLYTLKLEVIHLLT
jgi:hypothetical protein